MIVLSLKDLLRSNKQLLAKGAVISVSHFLGDSLCNHVSVQKNGELRRLCVGGWGGVCWVSPVFWEGTPSFICNVFGNVVW